MGRCFDDKICIMDCTRLSIDNTLHGSGRAVDRSGQIEKDHLRLKKHLKPVAILDATFLALRMQWPI